MQEVKLDFVFFFTCFGISVLLFQFILSAVTYILKREVHYFLYAIYLLLLSVNFIVNFYYWLPQHADQLFSFIKLFFGLPINYFIYLFYLLFIRAFLQLKLQSPSLNKKVVFIIGINILMGVSSAIGYYLIPVWDFWWQHANMLFTFSIFVYPMIILRKTKVKYSKFIIRGSICLMISILCNNIFSTIGIGLNYCDSMILFGTFIEILFFNYALQFKIKDQEQALLLSELYKQKAIKDEYSRVAADLHDEVGSTLSSIHINSVVSAKKIDVDILESKKLLQLISKQSKKMQHNLSDIVWGLRTDLDNIEDFTARLQEILEQTVGVVDINYTIEMDDNLTQIKLSVLQRRNLLLIAKEAFNNCVKYANASSLKVRFDMLNNVLQMKIVDNGKGFNLNDVGNTSNGLTNISNRITQLNGTVKIVSNNTVGTTILCEIPL